MGPTSKPVITPSFSSYNGFLNAAKGNENFSLDKKQGICTNGRFVFLLNQDFSGRQYVRSIKVSDFKELGHRHILVRQAQLLAQQIQGKDMRFRMLTSLPDTMKTKSRRAPLYEQPKVVLTQPFLGNGNTPPFPGHRFKTLAEYGPQVQVHPLIINGKTHKVLTNPSLRPFVFDQGGDIVCADTNDLYQANTLANAKALYRRFKSDQVLKNCRKYYGHQGFGLATHCQHFGAGKNQEL